jgi:Tfp pilus assembly protein PilX
MMTHAGNERGWVLVVAIVLMTLMLSLGLGAYAYVDQQSTESGKERTRESAFSLAEGSLTAELYTLSRNWPGTTPFPVCNQTSTDSLCPTTAKIASRFNQVDFTGTGAAATTWETRVIDDGVVTVNGGPVDLSRFYDDVVTRPQQNGTTPATNSDDANNNGQAWVRATATARGKTRTIVALVKIEQISISFPHAVMTAGRLRVITNGNGNGGANTCPGMSSSAPPPIVCTSKNDGTPTPINVRCTSPTYSSVTKDAHDFVNGGTNCLDWSTGQVAPIGGVFCGAGHNPPDGPPPADGCGAYSDTGVVPSEALDGLREQAQSTQTYCGIGGTNNPTFCDSGGSTAGCPKQSALESFPSGPTDQPRTVFVEQTPPSGCQYSGNAGTALFPANKPGTWVLASGPAPCTSSSPALDFSGSVVVNALIYSPNLQGWSNAPSGCPTTPSPPNVNIRGNARVVGAIAMDADALLQINANANNVRYNDVVIKDAKVFGTAGIVQNTWRELTAGQ